MRWLEVGWASSDGQGETGKGSPCPLSRRRHGRGACGRRGANMRKWAIDGDGRRADE